MAAVASTRSGERRALAVVLVVNAVFTGAEVAGGLVFSSLALLADAAHMASDVAALGVALAAVALAERPHTARHTYGLQRAEVLGAVINAVALFAVSAFIVYEAVGRLGHAHEVAGGGLLLVASFGLLVNVGSAVVLARTRRR